MHPKPTFIALGDSYTIGEGVLPAQRWPTQLCHRLDFATPDYIAQTGWTTQELLEAIQERHVSHFYDWVSLIIGVNNQYGGQDLEQFSVALKMLLYQALAMSHSRPERVLVLSVPDYSVTPFAADKNPPKIHDEIRAINAVAKDLARREGMHFVDITEVSRRAEQEPGLLAEDQLHPSGRMYRLWVDQILQQVDTFSAQVRSS